VQVCVALNAAWTIVGRYRTHQIKLVHLPKVLLTEAAAKPTGEIIGQSFDQLLAISRPAIALCALPKQYSLN
jgi:hypothetical protein